MQALQELQEHRDRAARAASRRTSDQTSREPSGSKQKIFKSASVVRDTPEVERLVLKRKQPVSVIGVAPDPDEDPTPGNDESDDEDDDDDDPPPTPSRNRKVCLRCVTQGNTVNCIAQPGKPRTQACLRCHQQRQWCSWSGENAARRSRRKKLRVDKENRYQGPARCVAERSLNGELQKQFSSLLEFANRAASAMVS
ncbi:hypothetical protein J3R30DRAFT_3698995 [Lentinula aciculospora]|uniref:Uncharacterized protein n=1 Tax=Lentinula aciculospora TaxID=153920 RepID=A0A9W9AKG4_9AGAR|nr:hypothetical protein J3R30DRAFT_3698995 [Lentinula aciculospora]